MLTLALTSTETAPGLSLGLLAAALFLGLRHGIDWDHIAAITDISAGSESLRRGFRLGMVYVLGHAVVVMLLGSVIIALGLTLPSWVDALMGRVVGATLVLLGIYVAYALVRDRGRFRPVSRWMLVIRTAKRQWAAVRRRRDGVFHAHPHPAVEMIHHDGGGPGEAERVPGSLRVPLHSHPHSHAAEHDEVGTSAVLGIGALHGIGAETPTQVLLFLAVSSVGGIGPGLIVLGVFLAGLVIANTAITLLATFGFAIVTDRSHLYVALGTVTAVLSLLIGGSLLLGGDGLMPAILG